MIIDFHTHIYPEHLAAETLAAVCDRSAIRSYPDGTLNGLLNSMREAGIDISVICSVATRPEQVGTIHQWLKGVMQHNICALATMHPDLPVDPDQIKTLKAQGFKGFKLHPDYQDFFVDEKIMYPFYEAVQAEGMLILFHAGVDRGLPTPIHATPERLARLLKDFPRLSIVAAHMGGEDVYEDTERYLLGKDIYLDTSFVLREMPVNIIERFIKKHPIERFLFGSDSPWTDQATELNFLLSLPFLTEDAKEKITGTNSAGLLGL